MAQIVRAKRPREFCSPTKLLNDFTNPAFGQRPTLPRKMSVWPTTPDRNRFSWTAARPRHCSAKHSRYVKYASSGSRASWTSGISRCLSPLPRRIMSSPRRAETCTSGIWRLLLLKPVDPHSETALPVRRLSRDHDERAVSAQRRTAFHSVLDKATCAGSCISINREMAKRVGAIEAYRRRA